MRKVASMRLAGSRLIDIAAYMNEAGHLTPGGSARWYASHVSRLLRTNAGEEALRAAVSVSTPKGEVDPGPTS
jgi:hypothetical protein